MTLITMLMTFCGLLMTIQLASCGNHGESDFKTDKKRAELGDENPKKMILSEQGVKVSERDCTESCFQDNPMDAGQCPCHCDCGFCPHWNFEYNRKYVCCSCPSSSSSSSSSSGCFPSFAKVILENGNSKVMSELQVGDRVQTVSSNGDLMFSEVRTFMKRQHDLITTYKLVKTHRNNTKFMTEDHLIYAKKISTISFHQIYADQVSVGDEVLVNEKEELIPTKVINISDFTMQGTYTPLTMEGNIIVNGILASCYAFGNHDLAHVGVTPIRWFPEMMELIIGEDNGFSLYAKTAEDLTKWMLPLLQEHPTNAEF